MTKVKAFLGAAIAIMTLSAMPLPAFADSYYTVKSGDTLWNISRTYGTIVERIQDLNSLESSLIFPGQSLLIAKDGKGSPEIEVSRGTSRVDTILAYAKSFIGVPYVYGGESPKGFDCSGYIQYVFKRFGMDLPRTADEQFYGGNRISSQEAKPGDIVAFKSDGEISHTGIYIGGGRFISATSSSGVMISSVYGPYWGEHFYGFSRIVP